MEIQGDDVLSINLLDEYKGVEERTIERRGKIVTVLERGNLVVLNKI